jgi:hypothetical protein
MGGQLATTLALTECRAGEPAVVAAAVGNPILNWAELGGGPDASFTRARTDEPSFDINGLLYLRSLIFRRPQHYFDPIASPILFFRSAGVAVPDLTKDDPLDDMAELAFLEREDFFRQQQILSAIGHGPDSSFAPVMEGKTTVKKRASKRFPSNALGLRFPRFYTTAGSGIGIADQVQEFSHLIQQSIERQRKKMVESMGIGRLGDFHAAEEKPPLVSYREHEGSGVWDESEGGRMRMREVAGWMADVLNKSDAA